MQIMELLLTLQKNRTREVLASNELEYNFNSTNSAKSYLKKSSRM